MEKAYVYDFDKTIYSGDSTIDFFFFCLKKKIKLIKYLPIILYYFILHFFKKISTKEFKEHFFSFLKEFNNIDEIVKEFWNKNQRKIYNYFNEELNNNYRPTIYIISASPKFLLEEYTKKLKNVKLLATDMNKKTGKIKGENCKGAEKLNLLPKNIKIEKFYSDSYSDRFLAEKSENSYIVWNGKISEWTKEKFQKKKENKIAFLLFLLFFTIYLILGIHLSYLYNASSATNLIYSADSYRVTHDLSDIFGNHYRIKVHPLLIIFTAPLIYILKGITNDAVIATIIFSSIVSALSVVVIYKTSCLFIRKQSIKLLIALIFGFTFTSIIFSSTIETFNISGLFLLLLWYITIKIFMKEKVNKLDLFYLYFFGLMSFSITITNYIIFLIVSFILLISKKVSLKKIFLINVLIIASALFLSIIQNYVWHNTPTLLDYSTNYEEEKLYINWNITKEKIVNVINYGYINSIISSSIIQNGRFIVFDSINLFPYLISSLFYVITFIFLIKNFKNNKCLNFGIILSIIFNIILHIFYGNTETFLYSYHFIFYSFLLLIINYENISKFHISSIIKILLFLILITEIINNAIIYKQILVFTSNFLKSSNFYLKFSNPTRLLVILLLIACLYLFCYTFYVCLKKILVSKNYEIDGIYIYIIGCICSIILISLIFIGIQTTPYYNKIFDFDIKN